jgi:hypothetical protein
LDHELWNEAEAGNDMQRKVWHKELVFMSLLFAAALAFAGTGRGSEQQKTGQATEPELIIAKYGSVAIKSTISGAKIYVDDIYKGGTDTVVENIVVGEHVISCRTEGRSVSGMFHIKKNETLRLEARFDEGKLVVLKQPVKVEVEKKKTEPLHRGAPKRPLAEPKKAEQKNPQEDRRRTHLNVMRLDYDVTASPDIHVSHTTAPVITKYTMRKFKTGAYHRTKQGVLLCDDGPCELTWTASFIYTDETGKADALLLNWKETVFNGITPTGTSKRELECCLNGKCSKMEDNTATDTEQEYEVGRYHLYWTKTSVLVRRSDIMQEITSAGRSLADY